MTAPTTNAISLEYFKEKAVKIISMPMFETEILIFIEDKWRHLYCEIMDFSSTIPRDDRGENENYGVAINTHLDHMDVIYIIFTRKYFQIGILLHELIHAFQMLEENMRELMSDEVAAAIIEWWGKECWDILMKYGIKKINNTAQED